MPLSSHCITIIDVFFLLQHKKKNIMQKSNWILFEAIKLRWQVYVCEDASFF